MIINNVRVTRALMSQIAEWFDEGLCCYEIMNLCAQQYHGLERFQVGSFDPEIVVAALVMEGRMQVGNNNGGNYHWRAASREIEYERGIGSGEMRYRRPTVGRDGIPVIELRMTSNRYAVGGFFKDIFPDEDGNPMD
jgi:hypothetical protein